MLQWHRSACPDPLPAAPHTGTTRHARRSSEIVVRSANGALVARQATLKHSAGSHNLVAQLKSDGSKQQLTQPREQRSGAQSPPPYSASAAPADTASHSTASSVSASVFRSGSSSSSRSDSDVVEFTDLCDSDSSEGSAAAAVTAAICMVAASPLTVGEHWQLECAEDLSSIGQQHADRYRPRRASRIFTFESLPKKRSRRHKTEDAQQIIITVQ